MVCPDLMVEEICENSLVSRSDLAAVLPHALQVKKPLAVLLQGVPQSLLIIVNDHRMEQDQPAQITL